MADPVTPVPAPVPAKPFWQSKTLWINLLVGAIDIAGHLSGVIPPGWQPYITLGIVIGNMVLRAISGASLTVTTPAPAPSQVLPSWALSIKTILDNSFAWMKDSVVDNNNPEVKLSKATAVINIDNAAAAAKAMLKDHEATTPG